MSGLGTQEFPPHQEESLIEGRHCGTAAGRAAQCAASPGTGSQLAPACATLTSTVSGFLHIYVVQLIAYKAQSQLSFPVIFSLFFFFLFVDVSRYVLGLTRELKIPVGRMGCFSQKRNQNEPITVKLLHTWMEFNEYVIPQ